jgi:hypothetical protein
MARADSDLVTARMASRSAWLSPKEMTFLMQLESEYLRAFVCVRVRRYYISLR